MKTRISKHGKYEIREGVANEVGDSLKPGDILITRCNGLPVKVEVIQRLDNMDDLEDACSALPETTQIVYRFVAAAHPGFFAMHPYLVRISNEETSYIWTAEDTDTSPVKIKHPLRCDEPIVADKLETGTITAKKVYTDGTVKVPNMPGLYKDCSGDVIVAFHNLGSSKLYYSYITIEGQERLSLFEFARPVEDLAGRWAPYTRITSIEQLRKALNAEVTE